MLARRSPGAYGRPGLRGVGNDAAGSEASTLKISISSCPSVWHGCNSPKRKERRALSHFQWKHGTTLDASVLLLGESTPNREGCMSFIFMIMAVPFLSATGIYNPQVMHHGHCIAELGSFDALYCPASADAAPHYRKYRAR